MAKTRLTATWSGCLAVVLGLGFAGCAGRNAGPSAGKSSLASGGEEAHSTPAEHVSANRPQRAGALARARSRNAVVIPARPQDNPRLDPRLGTLLQVSPPTHSFPGTR